MRFFLLSVIFLFSTALFAQTEIKLEDIKNYIGDSVKLRAKIYGGKYLENAKGSPTFLSVGANYPNAPLTLVIWENVRKQFPSAPEELYEDKEVWITGKVQLYKEKPEIVISEPSDILEQ
jgi:hypothetical protein